MVKLKTSDWMKTDLVTVAEEAPLREAVDLMTRYQVSHLCVVGAGIRLRGVLSDRDLKRIFSFSAGHCDAALEQLTVKEVMTRDPVAARPTDPLDVTVDAMLTGELGMVPVLIPNGRLVGEVREADLLRAFRKLIRECTGTEGASPAPAV